MLPAQLTEHARKTERNFPGSQRSSGGGLTGQYVSLPSKRVNKDLAQCLLRVPSLPSSEASGASSTTSAGGN